MKRQFFAAFLFAVMSVTSLPLPVRAQDTSVTDAVIEKYIMEHPDVILSSLRKFRERDKITDEQSKLFEKEELSPVAGNPNGDVTVIEFFDYHCGYCKRFYPVVSELLEQDKNLKVVFKEFPILSEDSVLASKAALAVYSIDKAKYFPYHTALMKMQGQFDEAKLTDLAKQAGISEAAFKKALNSEAVTSELNRTKELAEKLSISGTPLIIIGKQMVPGAIDIDGLRAKIAMERQKKKP